MWNRLKLLCTVWYRRHFWSKEDYLGEIVGLRRKRWESDKMLNKRIEDYHKRLTRSY